MKLTDMLVSAIIKKGILCEARDIDLEFDIPGQMLDNSTLNDQQFKQIKVHAKVDHITIKFDKEGT